MVFCCIAIVGVAVIYFVLLWLRQLFSWPPRDKTISELPGPPRALTGNGAWPVYGHTRLFMRLAGDVALLFPPDWTEWGILWPAKYSRKLGDCFAIFIWGQWRVVVKGPERARLLMESHVLKEAWPWTPPTMLLGKSCLSFLEPDEREQLVGLIEHPLSQRTVIRYAPIFAEYAERCLDDIVAGTFRKHPKRKQTISVHNNELQPDPNLSIEFADSESVASASGPYAKVKWDALRSYTFDLVDGPILNMNIRTKQSEQSEGEPSKEQTPQKQDDDDSTHHDEESEQVQRDRMILWMDRMKRGLCVIKITFGPEWMYIWIWNEYGRALNARMHISKVICGHVKEMNKKVPVKHVRGTSYHDPATMNIPLWAWGENMKRNKETIYGAPSSKSSPTSVNGNRPRTRSVPVLVVSDSEEHKNEDSVAAEYVEPYCVKQDLARPRYENSPALRARKHGPIPSTLPSTSRTSDKSEAGEIMTPIRSSKQKQQETISILERLMRQEDIDGNGISRVVTTELSILLWMAMDAGNAWTAMALTLLATDKEALALVQGEIDSLLLEFGRGKLFTPIVLNKMQYVNALLYEAIRLCPAFLGGMKKTTETVEFHDAGIQIAKNTNVIFCQPTDMKFDIHAALGKKPEKLGDCYPSVDLHGFLPFQGLEVPLMVMQSKVFLVVLLQKYSPHLSKRRTLIRRVKAAMNQSLKDIKIKLDRTDDGLNQSDSDDGIPSGDQHQPVHVDVERGVKHGEMTQTEAMRLFTKIPFPEPRRVIHIRPRALD